MEFVPTVSGHTGFGVHALQLFEATTEQVEQVANFRFQVRDFSAPRMRQASSIDAPTLMEQAREIRSQLLNVTA